MASDTRTVIRSIQNCLDKQNLEEALEIGHAAIIEYDKERDYNSAITVLEKLIEIAVEKNDTLRLMKYLDNLKVRYLLSGRKSEFPDTLEKYQKGPQPPFMELLDGSIGTTEDENKFVLENIEKQSIFGNFVSIDQHPFLELSTKDDAIRVIEYYYDNGRYVINLVNMRTQLHESVNVDVGDTEEVDIVEREHLFKI